MSLQQLPVGILGEIISLAEKKYSMLVLCKATCQQAGKQIYSHGNAAKEVAPPLTVLLSGLEYPTPNLFAPFGRDLKLHFLARLRSLIHTSADVPKSQTYADAKRLIVVLKDLPASLVLFPKLESLTLGPYTLPDPLARPSLEPELGFLLASHSKPKRVCLFGQYKLQDPLGLAPGELCFADDWKPEAVTTHRAVLGTLPIVCHGTQNRVELVPHEILCWAAAEVRARYVVGVLKRTYPFLRDAVKGDHRARTMIGEGTTWTFVGIGRMNGWSSVATGHWYEEGMQRAVLREVGIALPGCEGYLKFESAKLDKDGARCDCGNAQFGVR